MKDVMSGSALTPARKTLPAEPKDIGGLTIGTHAAHIFVDSAEKQQRLFALVSESLQDPSGSVLYIAGKQGVKGIRLSMKDYGIDVGSIERQRKIKIVDSEDWYLTLNRRDFRPIGEIREQFSSFATLSSESGYYCVTIISETDAIVRKGFVEQYNQLELELGKRIGFFRAIFVCAYDERELEAIGRKDLVQNLSALHSTMLS
ncbi:MAG: MEDS domain-containing protein [Nitrososphaerales archaeon]